MNTRLPISMLVAAVACLTLRAAPKRPNILWLDCEGTTWMNLHCYGDARAITPNLDHLAQEGIRYQHAYTVAGVCAPSRSGIITGVYPTTLGTENMRSRGRASVPLPSFLHPFPYYLRQAGYFCVNNRKTDYNFRVPPDMWDESGPRAEWWDRPGKDQPFFAMLTFTGNHEDHIQYRDRYEAVTKDLTPAQRQDPDKLTLPPYYPDTPAVRDDWKRYHELGTAMDAWVGKIIQKLKDDGLYDNTIIFFWADHGVGLPRAKRWVYDTGTHVPLIVYIPPAYRTGGQGRPGTVSERMVSGIDFGPTVLNLAGVAVPATMQGRPFLGPNLPPARRYVYAARDRMDERYDIIRMAHDARFQYVRNYEPWKTWYQYMNTAEICRTMHALRRLHAAGKLSPVADRYFAPTKPVEELYDTVADPYEVHDLAGDPKYADTLARLRRAQLAWEYRTRDLGFIPEPIQAARGRQLGSRYAILRQKDDPTLDRRAMAVAVKAAEGISALPDLVHALKDRDASVRYWGAQGVANIGTAAASATPLMEQALADPSPVVRIAAAHALCRLGHPRRALPVLVRELDDGTQWVRLYAANVLDEIGEQARPVIPQMRVALKPRTDLYEKGKYVVRVMNHALNRLEGTHHQVR